MGENLEVSPEVPPVMPAVWFAMIQNERKGPLTISEVSNLAAQNVLEPLTLVWKKGMDEWKTAGEVPEIAPLVAKKTLSTLADKESLQRALDASKKHSLEAFSAFKTLIVNPLAGLSATYQALGQSGSFGVSVVFLVAYEIMCFLGLGVLKISGLGLVDYLKLVLGFAIPYGGLMLGLLAVRMLVKSRETWHADLYIASFAALLGGIGIFLGWVVGAANFEIIAILALIEFCFLVYVLYAGLHRIYGLSEALTVWLIPAIIVLCIWLSKMIMVRILQEYAHLFFGSMGRFM